MTNTERYRVRQKDSDSQTDSATQEHKQQLQPHTHTQRHTICCSVLLEPSTNHHQPWGLIFSVWGRRLVSAHFNTTLSLRWPLVGANPARRVPLPDGDTVLITSGPAPCLVEPATRTFAIGRIQCLRWRLDFVVLAGASSGCLWFASKRSRQVDYQIHG